jgi:hypothetical protein
MKRFYATALMMPNDWVGQLRKIIWSCCSGNAIQEIGVPGIRPVAQLLCSVHRHRHRNESLEHELLDSPAVLDF